MNAARRPLLTMANVIGYQLVWIASIAGAGRGNGWVGPLAACAFVGATLAVGGRRSADLRTLGLVLPLGLLLDSLFAASGWISYAEPGLWPNAAPIWIGTLWAAFAMTLNHSLAFLAGHRSLAALLGVLGGPLAYWSAANVFGAVDFGVPPAWIMLALALTWGMLVPGLIALNGRWVPAGSSTA